MKILIADDSPVLRMAVTKLLEPEGYTVVAAEDGVEGIKKFYEEKPDLVLLDVQMPKLNGYVVCRLIKEDPTAAGIPVLILTVRNSAEDRYWGAKSGADGYLTKEALGDELLAAIRSALASRALRELSGTEIASPVIEHETDVLTRVCEVLDRKLFEATVVNEITSVAVQPVGLDGTVAQMLTALRRLVAFDAGAVVFPHERLIDIHLDHVIGDADVAEFKAVCAHHLNELAGAELSADDLELRPVTDVVGQVPEPQGFGSIRAVPLRSRSQLIAVFTLGAHRAGAFGAAQQRTLQTVTPSVAAVLDSARNFQASLETEARATFSSLF